MTLHGIGDLVGRFLPDLDLAFVLFLLGQQTAAEVAQYQFNGFQRLVDDGLAFRRDGDIGNRQGGAGFHGVFKTDGLDAVRHVGGDLLTAKFVHFGDQVLHAAFVELAVDELHLFGQFAVEQHASDRGIDHAHLRFGQADVLVVVPGLHAEFDLGMYVNLIERVSEFNFIELAKDASVAAVCGFLRHGQVVHAQHHILGRGDDRFAVSGFEQVAGGEHQFARFLDRFLGERNVNSHLIAVEVRVEGGRYERMQLNGRTFDEDRLERLDTETVQGGSAVQQHGAVADDAFERFPHFGAVAFDQAAGALHVGGVAILHEAGDHERTIQFERHALGQTALIQFELRTDHDHGTTGVVHTFAEQVAAEATLLAFEHIAQRLEFAAAAAGECLAALAVVDEAVNGFLKHALLVADDDIRCAEFEQSLQAVVAVDDAAIEIVEIGSGEASTVQLHHRAQVGRDHREHGQDHPLGAVA